VTSRPRLTFGPFLLDPGAYRLTRDGVDVVVSPRAIDLLALLAGRPSALVAKEELIAAGWPDVAVSDNSLTQAISDLREALGDSASQPTFIQTVARRGYRFIAEVHEAADGSPVAGTSVVATVAVSAPDRPRRARETSSLEAARAFSEGRWRLEALDADLVPAAIEQFERAIELDPSYAAAWLGLANARFWQAEASRDLMPPDTTSLARAVDAARRAVTLEPDLGEAQATLGYVLVGAGQADEARAAAARAVALEPGYWAHHFRLGHASWGEARLRAHVRALELYPDFAFAHLQMAMVFVARGDLSAAESALRQGLVVHDRHRGQLERFPAQGLHWLLGLVLAARGDLSGARTVLEEETQPAGGRLYAREFSVGAQYSIGAIWLAAGDAAQANAAFERALAANAVHARALVGRAAALARLGPAADAAQARQAADAAAAGLMRVGRLVDVALCRAADLALQSDDAGACRVLSELVDRAPAGPAGWNIPIEPAFTSLRGSAPFESILSRVAARAR
jgi:transcriptional activator of cad operon